MLQTDYWVETLDQTAEAGESRLQKLAAIAEHARKQPRWPGTALVHSWSEEEVLYLDAARPTNVAFGAAGCCLGYGGCLRWHFSSRPFAMPEL